MSQGRCLTDLLYRARLRSSEREMKGAHLGTKPNQYWYCNCTRLSLAITYKGGCTFEQFFFKVHIDSPLYCLINGDMQNKKLRWWISDYTINNQNKRELVPKVIYYFSMNKNVRERSDKKGIAQLSKDWMHPQRNHVQAACWETELVTNEQLVQGKET